MRPTRMPLIMHWGATDTHPVIRRRHQCVCQRTRFHGDCSLPLTGLEGPSLTITSYEVRGNDKLVHLSGLPGITPGEEPLSPVCGTVSSECLSGPSPTTIRNSILQTPLVWCTKGKLIFSVGSMPHSTTNDDEIMGWIGVNDHT
jgi:hypothetical protein